MSRRNMSERMCTGLMLCEAVACLGACVLPLRTPAPPNELNKFINLVGPQNPKLLNLLGRIGAHNQNNPENPASMPNLYEDEKALLIKLMNEIPAKGEKQEKIFNAMKKAFGITDRQIDEMLKLESAPNGRRTPDLQPGAVLASA
jgi:hypothetical protein